MTPSRQAPAGKRSGKLCGEPETAGPPGSSIGLSCVVWKSRPVGQEDGRLKTNLKGGHQAGTGALDLPTDALPVGGPWWETPPCPRVEGQGPAPFPRLCACACPTHSCTPPAHAAGPQSGSTQPCASYLPEEKSICLFMGEEAPPCGRTTCASPEPAGDPMGRAQGSRETPGPALLCAAQRPEPSALFPDPLRWRGTLTSSVPVQGAKPHGTAAFVILRSLTGA